MARGKLPKHYFAPWYRWESELYSTGSCIRFITGYPQWLPIVANSDHGVNRGSKIWPNENEDKRAPYLTWNEAKSRKLAEKHGIDAHFIQHPWVSWRDLAKIAWEPKGEILLFYPHSTQDMRPKVDLTSYLKELEALRLDQASEIRVVLHPHDFSHALISKLESLGLETLSFGSSSSPMFVTNFYSTLKTANMVVALNPTSALFFAIELGVPVWLMDVVEYESSGGGFIPKGKLDERIRYDDEVEWADWTYFNSVARKHPKLRHSEDQVWLEEYASRLLGKESSMNPRELRRILLNSIKSNLWPVIRLYLLAVPALVSFCIRSVRRNFTSDKNKLKA